MGGLGMGVGLAGLAVPGCTSTPEESLVAKLFADQSVIADGTPQRTMWALRDDEGLLGDLSPASVGYQVLDNTGAVIAEGRADRRTDGVASPFYVLTVAFTALEVHEFRIDAGDRGRHVGFCIPSDPSTSALLWPGDPFPSLVTPTFTNDAGVSPICTRAEPCPFHEISLDESLAAERSTLVMVSTPAFCATATMCGPVLEVLVEEGPGLPPGLDVIHAEVYASPRPDELGPVVPLVAATGVTYEPFVFLVDPSGHVVDRLDHIWDRSELLDLISRA